MKKKTFEPVDAVSAPAKEVLLTSEKEENKIPLKHDDHFVGDDGDRLFTRDEVTRILKGRLNRYTEGVLGNLKCKDFDEVKDLVEYARSVLHVTENFSTTSKSAYDNALAKYEEKPKPELNFDLFEGIHYGLNMYATYFDVNVRAVLDGDGYIRKIPSTKYGVKCCYLFMGDSVPCDVNTVVVSFSEFIKMVEKAGYSHISHLFDDDYVWHLDAIPSFERESLTKSFENMPQETKNQYLFLFKIRRLVNKE